MLIFNILHILLLSVQKCSKKNAHHNKKVRIENRLSFWFKVLL